MRHVSFLLALLALAAVPAVAMAQGRPQAPAASPSVGVTSAVNTEATSTPPAAATRTLFIGASLVMQERVRTGPEGTVQIAFIDRSTISMARSTPAQKPRGLAK